MTKAEKRPPLEDGLIVAMQALDAQIAREMQRSPAALERHGVQKWEPIAKRVELVTVLVIDAINSQETELTSVLVLAQAFTKAINLLVQDLGQAGLGQVRSSYTLETMKQIVADAERASDLLKDERVLS